MPSADQIAAFDQALGKAKADADTISLDQAALDKSNASLAAAQADVTAKTTTVTADLATMQADLDAVNVAGAALGLKVNPPAA